MRYNTESLLFHAACSACKDFVWITKHVGPCNSAFTPEYMRRIHTCLDSAIAVEILISHAAAWSEPFTILNPAEAVPFENTTPDQLRRASDAFHGLTELVIWELVPNEQNMNMLKDLANSFASLAEAQTCDGEFMYQDITGKAERRRSQTSLLMGRLHLRRKRKPLFGHCPREVYNKLRRYLLALDTNQWIAHADDDQHLRIEIWQAKLRYWTHRNK